MPQNRGDGPNLNPACALESLESRLLLSVTLDGHGTLHIEGTRRSDVISITSGTSKGRSTLHVALNGQDHVFRTKVVRKLQIITGKGDDSITTGVAAGSPRSDAYYYDRTAVPMTVLAGAGDDTLAGSDADDLLDGEAGNDRLLGYGGNDSILCGDGNDTVLGGAGVDTIAGGNGDDNLAGDVGYINHMPIAYLPGTPIPTGDPNDAADVITGGSGLDTFHNGDARDQQKDAGRDDRTVEDPIVS